MKTVLQIIFVIVISLTLVYTGDHYLSVTAEEFITDHGLKLELLAEGFKSPISMAFLGQNDLLVLEKEGKVQRVIDNKILPYPVLDITSIINSAGERGLLGIAISEGNGSDNENIYNQDFDIYLLYTEKTTTSQLVNYYCSTENCKSNDLVVNSLYKYKFKNDKLVNPELLLRTPVDKNNSLFHIGGVITVGPDNNVYVTAGDGNICVSPEDCEKVLRDGGLRSQTANFENGISPSGVGGILSVNVNGKITNSNNILGYDYPLNLYYAYGIRNSFGIDFDPVTGYLWDTENGPAFGDEINLVKPGFNSGWAKKQGVWSIVNPSQLAVDPPPGIERGYHFLDDPQIASAYERFVNFNGNGKYSDPEFTWNYTVGVTAIEFFNSDKLGEEYENDLFIGTFNDGLIYNFGLNNDRTQLVLNGELQDKVAETKEQVQDNIFGKNMESITDLETGPDGYLYVLSIGEGKLWRIVPV